MKLIQQIKNQLMYPAAYTYIALQSKLNAWKSLGKKDQVKFVVPYAGQKVMLMALYEKGRLREDVVAALAAAKALGIYVIGVNTLKLASPDDYRHCMDCYIERFNFGRDFGSYKSGFSYIYSNGLAEQCPRLLMINDSVFFSKKHISQFLQDMFVDDVEVLGATENFEIEHHLGSFCIAMDNGVLKNTKFKKYWKNYRCSDVRPKVIKTGEMELSKVLKRVVTSPGEFRALYDTARAALVLQQNPALLDEVASLSRSSEFSECPKFSFSAVSTSIVAKYIHSTVALTGVGVNVDVSDLSTINMQYARSVTEFYDFICNSVSNSGELDITMRQSIRDEVIANFVTCFSMGSQIHQNNIFLHKIGLPIIKLDGIYRGMFNARDVEKLTEELDAGQQDTFRRIMYSRPFGRAVLFGWKRAAFLRGLI
ncbi:rhamnan synthesis F family protein [Ectopseudomonas oleovorans]|uniref:rhamnan synthesis F family protein n=1 Tax=Ectopseudomonas oleovorans TaxID=301 RepID=UPI00244CB6AF|nr:rhamnan synthesis F family protein [Pseudomonas oleovorans]MDG9980344.1 hypothetical protein [Pseudomonas oleovorans]